MHIETPRKLNLSEKRKLETLIFSEIDRAESQFIASRNADEEKLKTQLTKHPSTEAAQLLDAYVAAEKDSRNVEKRLEQLGYYVRSYTGEPRLYVNTGNEAPKAMRDFQHATSKGRVRFGEMKRTYTLKLYASAGDAQALFAQLTKELANLTA